MPDYETIGLDEVRLGQQLTVWTLYPDGERGPGQGGTVTALTPELVVSVGATSHAFPVGLFTAGEREIEVEVPLEASECVNYGPDCKGAVDYFDPAGRSRGVPRCGHHVDERIDRYENSSERYAFSAVVPDWFDESYAGERWDSE